MASVRNSTAAKWLVVILTALMGVGVLGTSLAYAAGTNEPQGANGDADTQAGQVGQQGQSGESGISGDGSTDGVH